MLRCGIPIGATMITVPPSRSARPRQGHWTYRAYRLIADDGRRHEVLDGRHYVTPAPDMRHQEVSGNLYLLLRAAINTALGRVLYAPLDVHLGRRTIVQPDLVVVLATGRAVMGEKKVTGPPDLVVEILSPGTVKFDRTTKLRRYERAGVPEYWIVDPRACLVEQHVLRSGRYGKPVVSATSIRLRVVDATIDVRAAW
jgi:Uma2 family endonuclease